MQVEDTGRIILRDVDDSVYLEYLPELGANAMLSVVLWSQLLYLPATYFDERIRFSVAKEVKPLIDDQLRPFGSQDVA